MNPVDCKYLLVEIAKSKKTLNTWDRAFVSSIRNRADKGIFLTEKQSEVLQKIYRKMC